MSILTSLGGQPGGKTVTILSADGKQKTYKLNLKKELDCASFLPFGRNESIKFDENIVNGGKVLVDSRDFGFITKALDVLMRLAGKEDTIDDADFERVRKNKKDGNNVWYSSYNWESGTTNYLFKNDKGQLGIEQFIE